MMLNMKPVLISGAGLGGLLLARSLRNSNIPFLLFERDSSVAARGQGYRIRVSSEGLTALEQVLTAEQYAKFLGGTASTAGDGGGIHSLDAITGAEKDSDFGKPKGPNGPGLGDKVLGVARGFLRQCLLDGLEDVVHWAKRSTGYTLSTNGVTINFADGSQSPEGSLLVAADGPHSEITKQLTNGKVRAYDTGARMIHGQAPACSYEKLGVGVWSIQDDDRPNGKLGLITNVHPTAPGEQVEFGWTFVGGPGTIKAPGDDWSVTGRVAADLSRELTAQWHERFRPLFEQQNDQEAAFLKMSTAHPDGVPKWPNEPRVTILGDAAHCMTPAGGVGANTALRDAALIGSLVAEAGGWKEDITSKYEHEMRIYASANVKMSFEAAAKHFGITKLV